MGIKNRGIIILAVVGALFWQCSETIENVSIDMGMEYFPLKIGSYRIYQVRGARKDFSQDSVEFSYLLKESVIDSFQNLEGGTSYKIERQKKYQENDLWETDSIWTARVDDKTAVRNEHNIPIVSLTFPLVEYKTWDGNMLNGNYEKEFEMINVGEPYSDLYISYEPTVTVIQDYFPNDEVVKYISEKEIYAKSIGLVYKEIIILKHEQLDVDPVLPETNLDYYQHLIEYGEE